MKKKILITGASGGFGALTVHTLLTRGHTVVASMRDPDGRNQDIAEELSAAGAHIISIDVTDDISVRNGVLAAIEVAGGLDILINNAGVGMLGIQEAFTADDLKKSFDINVFGLHRMTREVFPYFRGQKSGCVINISSVLGRITIPFYGPYNASKWAVEALTENSRTEGSAFGIDVALVEPGGYGTSFQDNLIRPSDRKRVEELGDFGSAPEGFLESYKEKLAKNPAQDPQDIAYAVAELVDTPHGERTFRVLVDEMGVGAQLAPYNDQLHGITEGLYGAFGIADMLKVKS